MSTCKTVNNDQSILVFTFEFIGVARGFKDNFFCGPQCQISWTALLHTFQHSNCWEQSIATMLHC